MVYNVYAIRDIRVGFMSPILDKTDESAARNFASAVMRGEGLFADFSRDFDLYRIGTFDEATGHMTPLDVKVLIISGSSILQKGDDSVDEV